jgi:hypothetical protein
VSFFDRVLPSEGGYTLMVIDPARSEGDPRRVSHLNGLDSVPRLEIAIQRLASRPLNIYHAVGSYAGNNRAKPVAKRCIFLDLDAKDFGGDKARSIKEFVAFTARANVPPPTMLVDSGGGVHVYWTLNRDVPVDEWKTLAGALKKKCIEFDFSADAKNGKEGADPSVTSDAARVLRCPGTLNYKYSPPAPCRMLKDWGFDYEPAALLSALSPERAGAASILAGTVGADDLVAGNGPRAFTPTPYYTPEIINRCGVFAEASAVRGKDHAEGLWSNILSLLTFTEDGAEWVHPLSDGHDEYNEEKTESKFQYKLGKKATGELKPILCETFATYKSAICQACPFNGKIKTPLVLGKPEGGVTLPGNYRMTDDGVLKLVRKSAEGDKDTPDEWKLIFPIHIANEELINTGEGEETFRAMYTSRKSRRVVETPVTLYVKEGPTVFEHLMQNQVYPGNFNPLEFKGFMMSWLKRIHDVKLSTESKVTSMGWSSRNKNVVFATAKKVFHADGKEEGFNHREQALLDIYIPKGRVEIWMKAAEYITGTKRHAANATLLSSFMAPLMNFTGQSGVTFSIFSVASGTGKSSVLKVAQAVWGHPKTGVNSLNDTANSVTKKLGFLGHLPLYWDEIRGDKRTIEGVVYQVIFGLGQGSEKKRLDSNARTQKSGYWDTLVTTASNLRITDHIDQIIRDTNAGRARVFEVEMPPVPAGGMASTEFDWALKALESNYGGIGESFAKYLATNEGAIRELVRGNQQAFADELNSAPLERYWLAFIACAFTACQLVNALGYFTIDEDDFRDWLKAQFVKQRTACGTAHVAPTEGALAQLFRFVDEHRPNTLVTDIMPAKGRSHMILVQPVDKEIIVLKASADNMIRVKESSFKKWLYMSQGVSSSAVITELTRCGAVQTRKASITAGLANASDARITVLEIDLSHTAAKAVLGT